MGRVPSDMVFRLSLFEAAIISSKAPDLSDFFNVGNFIFGLCESFVLTTSIVGAVVTISGAAGDVRVCLVYKAAGRAGR